jgi:hypothetical protein
MMNLFRFNFSGFIIDFFATRCAFSADFLASSRRSSSE